MDQSKNDFYIRNPLERKDSRNHTEMIEDSKALKML